MSGLDTKIMLKALSPRIVAKVTATLDNSSLMLSGIAWLAMIVTMALTLYTMNLAIAARQAALAGMVAEPHLPKTINSPLGRQEIQTLIERMKRLYPNLEFTQSNDKMMVATSDGEMFREWLTALSYIDSITPQYHWSMNELCVGKCGGKDLMRAELSGKKISYEAPASD